MKPGIYLTQGGAIVAAPAEGVPVYVKSLCEVLEPSIGWEYVCEHDELIIAVRRAVGRIE